MKIVVSVLYTDSWVDIARVVLPNLYQYCKRHGYYLDARCFPEPYPSDFGFRKIDVIKELFLYQNTDIVWSLDLDTMITNHRMKIEDFVDEDHDFFITKDYNGINGGSFIVKKSDWAIKFLDYLLNCKGCLTIYCEQDAINDYMQVNANDPKIKILPHPSINSYHYELYHEIPKQKHEQGNWQEYDFVLHLPGIGMSKRLAILKSTKIIT